MNINLIICESGTIQNPFLRRFYLRIIMLFGFFISLLAFLSQPYHANEWRNKRKKKENKHKKKKLLNYMRLKLKFFIGQPGQPAYHRPWSHHFHHTDFKFNAEHSDKMLLQHFLFTEMKTILRKSTTNWLKTKLKRYFLIQLAAKCFLVYCVATNILSGQEKVQGVNIWSDYNLISHPSLVCSIRIVHSFERLNNCNGEHTPLGRIMQI